MALAAFEQAMHEAGFEQLLADGLLEVFRACPERPVSYLAHWLAARAEAIDGRPQVASAERRQKASSTTNARGWL